MSLKEQLQKYFGFNSFKHGQEKVVKAVLNNRSAAAIFPTGAGKSLCYQLPAVMLPGLTLVVSPLLSLMKDQIDFLLEHNISAARLDSTLTIDEYNSVLERAKNGDLKILMISVERFRNERFRYHLKKMKISLLVIDEAHCISEWGHNFRPEYLKLPDYQKEFQIRQVLLLTATATEKVIDDMCAKFNITKEDVIITGFYRENLFLQISSAKNSERNARLLKRISEKPQSPAIVYVTLQKTAESVAEYLQQNKINAHCYHAGMESDERESIQKSFMDGELSCIVATIAFGMGIDKKDIRRIIHYNLPKSIENYSQEIGRSGRDGQLSLCEVLANRGDISILENFIYGDTPEKFSIYTLLQQVVQNNGFIWEVNVLKRSNELNIRLLPLKTLLVYLEMEGIIRPKMSYFEEYEFKYCIDEADIVNNFQGERKQFVAAIFDNCITKLTWTTVNISEIMNKYGAQRHRIVAALEYFNEKGWIELRSKRTIEVYDILTQAFNIDDITEKMYDLFIAKQDYEIKRIHDMVSFFESTSCINKQIAEYFGEAIEKESCGHCSFCESGKAVIQSTDKLKPLSNYDFNELSADFKGAAGNYFTKLNLTKYLCGINSPVFTKLKIKKLPYFGVLENYPFQDVKSYLERKI